MRIDGVRNIIALGMLILAIVLMTGHTLAASNSRASERTESLSPAAVRQVDHLVSAGKAANAEASLSISAARSSDDADIYGQYVFSMVDGCE